MGTGTRTGFPGWEWGSPGCSSLIINTAQRTLSRPGGARGCARVVTEGVRFGLLRATGNPTPAPKRLKRSRGAERPHRWRRVLKVTALPGLLPGRGARRSLKPSRQSTAGAAGGAEADGRHMEEVAPAQAAPRGDSACGRGQGRAGRTGGGARSGMRYARILL